MDDWKLKDWLMIGGGVLAAWWLYQQVTAVHTALKSAGEKVGGAVFDALHPNAAGESLFYTVRFSNGSFSIPSGDVLRDGSFMFRGVQFWMRNDAQGMRYAVRVP